MKDQKIIKTSHKVGRLLNEEFSRLYPHSSIRLSGCTAMSVVRGLTVFMKGVASPNAVLSDGEELYAFLYASGSAHIALPSGCYSAVVFPERLLGELRDEDGETVATGDFRVSPQRAKAPIEIGFHGVCSVDIGFSMMQPLHLEICCDAKTDTSSPFGVSTLNCFRIDLTPFLL